MVAIKPHDVKRQNLLFSLLVGNKRSWRLGVPHPRDFLTCWHESLTSFWLDRHPSCIAPRYSLETQNAAALRGLPSGKRDLHCAYSTLPRFAQRISAFFFLLVFPFIALSIIQRDFSRNILGSVANATMATVFGLSYTSWISGKGRLYWKSEFVKVLSRVKFLDTIRVTSRSN